MIKLKGLTFDVLASIEDFTMDLVRPGPCIQGRSTSSTSHPFFIEREHKT